MSKTNEEPQIINSASDKTFTLGQLRAHSRELFGVSTSTFDGATSGLDISAEYTKERIKTTIETWGKAPINARKKESE